MELKRILMEACVLVSFGVLFGLMLNHQLVMDAFTGQLVSPQTVEEAQIEPLLPVPVLLEEVQQELAAGSIVVDARSPELFADGHIAGAISLPLVEAEDALSNFIAEVPKEKTIIVYCSGFGCPDSFDLAIMLMEAGYGDVRVFEGGFPEWRDAGLPIAGAGQ